MKLRKQKKEIPKELRWQMYESYKQTMISFGNGHKVERYKDWLIDVFNTKLHL